MPSCYDERILQGIGLSLCDSTVVVLHNPLVVVFVLSLSGINVCGINEFLHISQLSLSIERSFNLIEGSLQCFYSSIDSISTSNIGCSSQCVLSLGLYNLNLNLILLLSKLLAQSSQFSNDGSILQLFNVGISTVVGQLEVIPDTPQCGVLLQLSTYGQLTVFSHLYIDRSYGVVASGKRFRSLTHVILTTSHCGESNGLVVSEEYRQVIVVLTILTVEALSSQCIHTLWKVSQSLTQ